MKSELIDCLDGLLYYDTIPNDEKDKIRAVIDSIDAMDEIISFAITQFGFNDHFDRLLQDLDKAGEV